MPHTSLASSWPWVAPCIQLAMGRPLHPAGHGSPLASSWPWVAPCIQLAMGRPLHQAGHGSPLASSWPWVAPLHPADRGSIDPLQLVPKIVRRVCLKSIPYLENGVMFACLGSLRCSRDRRLSFARVWCICACDGVRQGYV